LSSNGECNAILKVKEGSHEKKTFAAERAKKVKSISIRLTNTTFGRFKILKKMPRDGFVPKRKTK